jgi:uncharacterized protein
MKKIILTFCMTLSIPVFAASFDCAKAKTNQEKLICSVPSINEADSKMGEAYKLANQNFPVKGFIPLSQRVFLVGYRSCAMDKDNNKNIKSCLESAEQRTAELLDQANSSVYSNMKDKFFADDVVITVSKNSSKPVLRFWGQWMPDAYNPKPFPDGFICNDSLDLKIVGSKITSTDPSVKVVVTDSKISIDSIPCSPRNGSIQGDYPKIR